MHELFEDRSYFEPGGSLSAYFSMVGPSGVGETFAVKQIAAVHGQYVFYVNLLPWLEAIAYPPKSILAGVVDEIVTRSSLYPFNQPFHPRAFGRPSDFVVGNADIGGLSGRHCLLRVRDISGRTSTMWNTNRS